MYGIISIREMMQCSSVHSPHTVPSAPKSEGGSSWYKSMFRSMLANDDDSEGTYHLLPIGSHDLCYI